jgi:putative oxidoreductase
VSELIREDLIMSMPRRAARAMLGASFIAGGIDQIRNPQPKRQSSQPVLAPIAERVPQLPNDPEQLIRLDGAIKVAGGLGMVFGPFARPAALVLAGSLVPTTFAGHRFWEQNDPEQKVSDRVEFFKNVSLLGGLLIAALDTGGRPSVPWMAGKAARGAAAAVGEAAEAAAGTAGAVGGAVTGAAGALGSGVAKGAGAITGAAGTVGSGVATTATKAAKAAATVKGAKIAGKAAGKAGKAAVATKAAKAVVNRVRG